jgi:hypothetical protein
MLQNCINYSWYVVQRRWPLLNQIQETLKEKLKFNNESVLG